MTNAAVTRKKCLWPKPPTRPARAVLLGHEERGNAEARPRDPSRGSSTAASTPAAP